ncbi:unnamed protein product [Tilletia controversa]|nr:unnamed protein product [Tilletia controversa]CAD6918401.1 unnamed protein product [Tilletia controversa]
MSFVTPPPLPTYSQVDFALTIGQEESFLNAAFDFTDGLQPIQHVNDLLFDFHFPPPSFELMRQNVDRLEQVKAGQLSIDDWIDALPEPLSQSVRNPSTDAQRKVMERLSQSQRQLSPEPTNAAESNVRTDLFDHLHTFPV